MKVYIVLLFCICVREIVAHGVLVQPSPRAGTNQGVGVKIPGSSANGGSNTCGVGGDTPGPISATYQAGTQIKVTWDTTIYHLSPPGVRIAIKYNSSDMFNNSVVVTGDDVGVQGCHTVTVSLAAGKTCDDCVLQWMWESTADGGYYIGCSDIKIQTAPVPTGTNSDAYYNSVCGTGTTGPNQQTSDDESGMSPGGAAVLSLFLIALVVTVVGSILFVKLGYGTIDSKFPFYHRTHKKGASDTARASGNYMAYSDDDM